MPAKVSPEGELLVGGQALIEGVMMRSPGAYGVAVRKPDGSMALQRGKVNSLGKRYPFLKLPILRGVAVLFQSLALGIRALNFSAEQAIAAVDEAEAKPDAGPVAENPEKPKEETSNWAIAGSMAIGLGVGVVFFLLLPLWLTQLSERYVFGHLSNLAFNLVDGALRAVFFLAYIYGPQLSERYVFGHLSNLAFNLVDGALRAVFFLAYIYGISRMKDIHRVFQYHGAEHKVVFAYEKRLPLTVENARVQSRLHPRCGTSFLLFVLLVSIVVFAFIPKTAPFLVKFGGRLLLVPAIAGISYEVLRFTAKHRGLPLFSLLVGPGLALQRITTQEPDDSMLEVAIVALEEALREDGLLAETAPRVAADPVAVAAAAVP